MMTAVPSTPQQGSWSQHSLCWCLRSYVRPGAIVHIKQLKSHGHSVQIVWACVDYVTVRYCPVIHSCFKLTCKATSIDIMLSFAGGCMFTSQSQGYWCLPISNCQHAQQNQATMHTTAAFSSCWHELALYLIQVCSSLLCEVDWPTQGLCPIVSSNKLLLMPRLVDACCLKPTWDVNMSLDM